MQVKKQQLEPVRARQEQRTGSKLGKENVKAVYCHPAYLTFMQSTSGEMLGWMKDKLKSRFQGTISITQICRWHQPYSRKWRRTKEPLDESERGDRKVGVKLNIQKTKIMASGPISSVQFSHSVLSDSLRPHELQHARPPCASPTPGVHSDSRSSSQWCHPAIS